MNIYKIILCSLIMFMTLNQSHAAKPDSTINDSTFNALFGDEQLNDSTIQNIYFKHYFDAQLLIDQNKIEQAKQVLYKCLKIDDNAAVHFQLYKVYRQLQNDSAAYSHINIAINQNLYNEDYLKTLANFYWEKRNYLEAYKTHKILHRLDPESSEYIYNIIYALKQSNGSNKEILKYTDKLEKIDGYSEEIAFERIKISMQEKKPKQAIRELKKAIEKFPYTNDFYIISAQIHEAEGQYSAAIGELNKALEVEPDNGNLIYYMSSIYKKQNDTLTVDSLERKALLATNTTDDLRVTLLKPIVTQLYEDKNIDSIYNLFSYYTSRFYENKKMKEYYITVLSELKDTANIVKVSKELIKQEPNNQIYAENIWSLIGNDTAYRYELTAYNDSIHDNHKWKYYKFMTYVLYGDSARIESSITDIIPFVTNKHTSSLMYGIVGDLNIDRDKKLMYAMYDSALVRNSENAMVLNNYAYMLYLDNKDIDKAEEMSARSIRLDPESLASIDTYARILFKQKEYFLAKFYIEQIFRAEHEIKDGYYEIYGDILFFLGQQEKAIEQWKKAMETDPKNEKAKLKFETKAYHE